MAEAGMLDGTLWPSQNEPGILSQNVGPPSFEAIINLLMRHPLMMCRSAADAFTGHFVALPVLTGTRFCVVIRFVRRSISVLSVSKLVTSWCHVFCRHSLAGCQQQSALYETVKWISQLLFLSVLVRDYQLYWRMQWHW